MSRTGIAICGAGALLLLGAGGYVMTTTAGGFDSDKWKAAQQAGHARDNPRAGMVRELKAQLHPGMTKAEVIALLGQPDTEEKPGRFVYALGMAKFAVDYEYYVIEFDRDGKLARHFLEQG